MDKDLKSYIDNNNLTSSFNILVSDMKNEWYTKLGEEIINIYGIDNMPLVLTYDVERLKDKKFTQFNSKSSILRSIGIFYLTGYLYEGKLEELFGEPIRHSEFGEGFHEYAEDDEDNQEIIIEEDFRSFFPIINNVKIHIGYDHRGTFIDIPNNTIPQDAYDIMITLVKLAHDKEK